MTPNTFVYRMNRNGRECEALSYICSHGLPAGECTAHFDGLSLERHMVEWWNNSFTQMQDRIVCRDRILHNDWND